METSRDEPVCDSVLVGVAALASESPTWVEVAMEEEGGRGASERPVTVVPPQPPPAAPPTPPLPPGVVRGGTGGGKGGSKSHDTPSTATTMGEWECVRATDCTR